MFERRVEEAVDVAVVQRLDAQHVRPGLEAGDHEAAVVAQREAADQRAGARVERDDVRAEHAAPFLVTLPLMLPATGANAAVG